MRSISISHPSPYSLPHSLTDSLSNVTLRMPHHLEKKTVNQSLQSFTRLAFQLCHQFQHLPPFPSRPDTPSTLPFLPLSSKPAKIKNTSLYSPLHFWHSSSVIPFNPPPFSPHLLIPLKLGHFEKKQVIIKKKVGSV